MRYATTTSVLPSDAHTPPSSLLTLPFPSRVHTLSHLSDHALLSPSSLPSFQEAMAKELQLITAERDRLSLTLEEALSRCTSSLVEKRLAVEECAKLREQLDAYRMRAAAVE
jgi:hypothetical protein